MRLKNEKRRKRIYPAVSKEIRRVSEPAVDTLAEDYFAIWLCGAVGAGYGGDGNSYCMCDYHWLGISDGMAIARSTMFVVLLKNSY